MRGLGGLYLLAGGRWVRRSESQLLGCSGGRDKRWPPVLFHKKRPVCWDLMGRRKPVAHAVHASVLSLPLARCLRTPLSAWRASRWQRWHGAGARRARAGSRWGGRAGPPALHSALLAGCIPTCCCPCCVMLCLFCCLAVHVEPSCAVPVPADRRSLLCRPTTCCAGHAAPCCPMLSVLCPAARADPRPCQRVPGQGGGAAGSVRSARYAAAAQGKARSCLVRPERCYPGALRAARSCLVLAPWESYLHPAPLGLETI